MTVDQVLRTAPHQHDHSSIDPDRPVWLVTTVDPDLTVAQLRSAADALSRRYEILRTRIEPAAGRPVQRVLPVGQTLLAVDEPGECSARGDEPGGPGGDRGQIRVTLGPQPGELSLQAPPELLDFWSLGWLARSLVATCRAVPGDADPLQYGDVAEWLHECGTDPEAAGVADRLAERAAAEPASVAAGAALATGPGGTVTHPVPVRLVDGPVGPARLLAAWQVVLHRYTGADELTVWWRADLRVVPELAEVAGPLSMRLPINFRAGELTRLADVSELATRTLEADRQRAELLGAGARRCGSFGLAVLAEPARDVVVRRAQIAAGRFDVDLSAWRVDGGFRLQLWSPPGAGLPAPLARQLLESVAAIAEQMEDAPDSPVSTVRLGAAAPATHTPPSSAGAGDTLVDRVMAAVRRWPDRVAVCRGERTMTYQQLGEHASAVAATLVSHGVGAGDVVAVGCADPVWMLLGQLGASTAGAAFLPVDIGDPPERLSYLLADSGAVGLLTDRPADDIAELPIPLPPVTTLAAGGAGPVGPRDPGLCYLLYTSGSTGSPKAVAVGDAAVVNYLDWLRDIGLVDQATVLPATTPAIFDASLKQIWAPLVAGATVLFPPLDEDPLTFLANAVGTGTANVVNTVPTLWRDLLPRLAAVGASHRVRRVLLGGEPLPVELLSQTASVLPGAEVWNLYGPTETTANASAGAVDGRITFGRPVSGCTLRILDPAGAPVPVGVVGELCVSGPALAYGYHRRPALTADRFVPDPGSEAVGARLYRTGDLARQLPDGELELMGRADCQLKLNGVRVEAGEIETVLRDHPAVSAAAVAARDGQLVAYLVAQPRPSATDLHAHCARSLPARTLPARFVAVTDLPRTPAGKLDRARLAHPDDCLDLRGGSERARTDEEAVLSHLWAEVLGSDRFGIEDSFFAVGGDSIRAMRLVALLRELVGIQVPLREVLSTPELAGQAEVLRRHDHANLLTSFAAALAAADEE